MPGEKAEILLLGAGGMLGTDLAAVLTARGIPFVGTTFPSGSAEYRAVDLTNSDALGAVIAEVKPRWIVNCTAYTDVDKAETEYVTALKVNADAVGELGRLAALNGAKVVHISTDYVFGGVSFASTADRKPLDESTKVAPNSVYSFSKWYGEELLRKSHPDGHLIVRSSWLYGRAGKNFVETIKKLAAERDELRVVDDQFGSPTWTGWLAPLLLELIDKDARGTFHVCCRGEIHWCRFAQEIARLTGSSCNILTQTTEQLNRPAPRPPYSVLAVGKVERLLGRKCLDWQEGLKSYLSGAAPV